MNVLCFDETQPMCDVCHQCDVIADKSGHCACTWMQGMLVIKIHEQICVLMKFGPDVTSPMLRRSRQK